MADEAIIVENPQWTHDFTVNEAATIEQFTLCKLADARTASASDGANVFAGIAMTEKKAGDGQVNLGLAHDSGIFVLKAAGGASITAGMAVLLSGPNLIKEASAGDLLTGAAFGKALEDIASGTSGEVRLGL